MEDDFIVNIRNPELLGPFIGRVVVDITQHDADYHTDTNEGFVQIMFDDASWIRFPTSEGKQWWFSLGPTADY